jgi:hypothetical protein
LDNDNVKRKIPKVEERHPTQKRPTGRETSSMRNESGTGMTSEEWKAPSTKEGIEQHNNAYVEGYEVLGRRGNGSGNGNGNGNGGSGNCVKV